MARIYEEVELLATGRYEIVSYLDEGGMQEVYLAEDTVFRRKVVVKVPKNDSAIKRFQRSAVLSARITHPNVAKTYDYFEHNAISHLVEEYLTGGNLNDSLLCRVDALDPYLTARLFHHIAKGLAAAHHADVVHRDLKPSNVMLSASLSNVFAKITDFGVAKMAQDSIAAAVGGGRSSITASKTAIGHLPYMAPELIKSPRDVRKPSDVWAVGALAYEMLSGDKPYGEGLVAVSAIMAAEPLTLPTYVSQSRQFKQLGQEVFDVITWCMAKDESSRPSADALLQRVSSLCYGIAPRKWGTVVDTRKNTGTVNCDDGEAVFFHKACVYGPSVVEGDRVLLSAFDGSPMARALPMIRARPVT